MPKKEQVNKNGLINKKIEKSAIRAIQLLTDEHDLLDDELAYNDKTESFDGFIKIYEDRNHSVESYKNKVDVQVKGTNNETLLNKEEITFPVKKAHLKNYLANDGVIYFVVAISNDKQRKTIFYKNILPIELQKYLEQIKKDGTKSKTIKLTALENSEDLFSTINNFLENKQKQGSKNEKGETVSIKVSNLNKYNPSKINASVKFKKKNLPQILEDITFYTQLDCGSIIPIDLTDCKIEASIVENNSVIINGKSYYKKELCITSEVEKNYLMKLSNNLNLIFNKNNSIKIEFKINNSSIKDTIYDLEFLIQLEKYKNLNINSDDGEEIFKDLNFKINKQQLDSFVNLKNELEVLKLTLEGSGLKTENIKLPFKGDELKTLDYLFFLNDNYNVFDDKNLRIIFLKMNGKYFPIVVEDKDDKYNFHYLFNEKVTYKNTYNNTYEIPFFDYFNADILADLNVEKELLKKDINNSELNEDTLFYYVNYLLKLISIYDKDKIKNKLFLDVADYLANIILDFKKDDRNIINLYQINVRQKIEFKDYNIEKLKNMLSKTKENDIKFAISVLLKDKPNANKYFKSIKNKSKKDLGTKPIYYLYQQLI